MTKLLAHIEDMRARLKEVADNEQALVKALADALDRLDQALLRDVQSIASAHEERREAILGELQGLASGIGMFRAPLAASCARGAAQLHACARARHAVRSRLATGAAPPATSRKSWISSPHFNGPHLNGGPSH